MDNSLSAIIVTLHIKHTYTTDTGPHRVIFDSLCKPDNDAYCFSKDYLLQKAFYCWLFQYNVVSSAPGAPNWSILQFIPRGEVCTDR